jgi:uncharacterized repeat protein (TIGR03806 family)
VPAEPARADAPPAYECRWAHDLITIDGKSDEPAWAAAQPLPGFRLAWLGADERPPQAPTNAKLLWDREYLYFLAVMPDRDLVAKVTEHDGQVWTDDAFELFIKPATDKPGYYEFEVNPANTVLDMFLAERDAGGYARFKSDGEFNVETAVRLEGTLNAADGGGDKAWTVEGRIPWRGFLRTGGRPAPGEVWTFAACRVDVSADATEPELSSSAVLKSNATADFHHFEDYSPLVFRGPDVAPGHGSAGSGVAALPPLTTSRVVGSPEPSKPYRLANAYPRLDIKHPVAVARQPGSNLMWLITEQYGTGPSSVLRFVDHPETTAAKQLLPIDGVAYSIAFHPEFSTNGFVYLGVNGPAASEPKKSQVVRYRVDPRPPYAFEPDSATVVIEWESNGHNGAAVDFGPDGMLYVTSGDGTSDSDTWLSGQDLSRPLAKVLRIDVDRPDPGKQYSVPPDNPFVGQPNVVPETWAYGLRNPWRIDVDDRTGLVWVGQNGQDQWEQVYLVEKGANYGWSVTEGSHPFYPGRTRGPHPVSPPIAEHPHSAARSLTGGIVYYGKSLPELAGAYVYGDYSTGKIWGLRVDGERNVTWHEEIADTTAQITSFSQNAAGELLVTDHGGHRICRLERVPAESSPPAFPRTLSASGLFESVKGHRVADGVLPYSVNAELWSDGAYKERFIAIPARATSGLPADEDRRIGFTNWRGWEFPNETVLIKSFAIETEAGNPMSRKWIETRFLTRQEGEWAGYSYVWNDEQTEATLVGDAGLDKEFIIADPAAAGGVRRQVWRYPSRTECMVCHTRAANYVLGLQTLQMNRDHDYSAVGGQVGNQLRTLEHLGMLRVPWAAEATAALQSDAKDKGLAGADVDAYVTRHSPQSGQRPIQSSSTILVRPPAAHDTMPDPYDSGADLNRRARAYLHANCANCHVEAGGGNAAMELEFTRPQDDMRLIGVTPLHGDMGIPGAKLVAPGEPDKSVLLQRMMTRNHAGGATGQMPPLATRVPDPRAAELMRQWIASLPKPATPAEEAPPGPAEPSTAPR